MLRSLSLHILSSAGDLLPIRALRVQVADPVETSNNLYWLLVNSGVVKTLRPLFKGSVRAVSGSVNVWNSGLCGLLTLGQERFTVGTAQEPAHVS
ncbi:hypothetical protein SHO565_60310 [Streptomyces sp. HO565]